MNKLVKLRKSMMLFVKIMIVAAVTVGFIQVWITSYAQSLFSNKGNYVVIFSFVLLFTVFSSLYGAFKIGIYRIHEIIYSFSLAVVFTNAIMYLELSLIARELVNIPPMLVGIIYQIIVVAICSFCANAIYFKLYPPRRVVAIFGDDVSGFELIQKMGKISDRFSIERGFNANTTDVESIKKHIDKYDAVVICGIDKNLQKQIISYCYTHEKRTYLLPDITDIIISNSYNIQISDTPVLMSRNRGLTLEQKIIKRAMDIFISALAITITSPIMLICAIAIKLDDGGPILFKQNRITINGKIFNVLKFRSMIVDADKDGAKKAVSDDDRITRVGKIIRACRMDELPQLFNILRGDMSLVGPRPERIENVYEYSQKYPEFELRHRVKGGLTGFAQLYGKYNTSPEDKLHMDLIYIETYSLLLDLKLLILTFKVLFMKESTEGFNEKANENVRASNSLKKRKREKKMSFNATLVVMAAGMGSRFGGLKQIEPVGPGGQAIIDFSVYDAKQAGFNKVVFIIKHEIEKEFKEIVGSRIEKMIDVDYAFQEIDMLPSGFTCPHDRVKPWGTAHAIYCARDKVNTPFAVINADDYYGKGAYKKMYEHLKQQKGDFCMVGFKLQNTLTENGTVSRGICEIENGILKTVTERTKILDCKYTEDDKTWVELPPDCIVSMNMWGFTPDVFNYIENDLKEFFAEKINVPKVEYYLPTIVSNVINRGQKDVSVLVAEDRWYGVTYKEDKDGVVNALKQKIDNGEYEGF